MLGYLVMLTLYKVGNQQFYLPWLLMVSALPLVNKQSADRMESFSWRLSFCCRSISSATSLLRAVMATVAGSEPTGVSSLLP